MSRKHSKRKKSFGMKSKSTFLSKSIFKENRFSKKANLIEPSEDPRFDAAKCLICHEITVEDNLECKFCHRLFCEECLKKWLRKRKRCPHCNKDMTKKDFFHSVSSKRILLATIEFKCEACNRILFLKDKSRHKRHCNAIKLPKKQWKEFIHFKKHHFSWIDPTGELHDINLAIKNEGKKAKSKREGKSVVVVGDKAMPKEGKFYFQIEVIKFKKGKSLQLGISEAQNISDVGDTNLSMVVDFGKSMKVRDDEKVSTEINYGKEKLQTITLYFDLNQHGSSMFYQVNEEKPQLAYKFGTHCFYPCLKFVGVTIVKIKK